MTDKLRLEWRDPATLTPNPRNFRRHPEEQKKLLAAVIDEVGWAGCILFNETTGRIIDGHARQEEAVRRKDAAVPVLVGNWTEQEELKILATFDPIAAMAQQADDIYRELLADVETENEDMQRWLDEMAETISDENPYTSKIEAPVYEPSHEKPALESLCDESKTQQLIEEIDKSGLPDDEKAFLRAAAWRHAVFHYERIADYYAHSDRQTQDLMEKSALVIIDFQAAIERGFVKLCDDILEQFTEEHGNAKPA